MPPFFSRSTFRGLATTALAVVAATAVVPRAVCRPAAAAYFDRDTDTTAALARHVAARIQASSDLLFFHTGDARFDGQSAVAIYQMTLLGLGQTILSHPELRAELLPAMRIASARIASPQTLTYAASRYGHNGIAKMGPGEGHAYLGYVNLGLGMMRLIDPETPQSALNDSLTAALAQRIDASRTGLIETYPGESWPPDVAAVVGSIGLHGRATKTDYGPLLARWEPRFTRCSQDASGYLQQSVVTATCAPRDAPRGSGTAVAAYFLSFAPSPVGARLYASLVAEGYRSLFGFGALHEYAHGHSGEGDLNAGPMAFGFSVGATGFGIGAAGAYRDRDRFVPLAMSAHLLGLEVAAKGERTFAAGGILGDALLLAMLTSRPP